VTEPLDALDLGDASRLAIAAGADGRTVVPMVRDKHGWRRAGPGDGVAEALLRVLADGPTTLGRFTVRSWVQRTATGERGVGVDQTNESVIVGDAAVVKWATRLADGPHPAPRRISLLRDAGFGGMPTPWGLITWRPHDSADTWWPASTSICPAPLTGGRGRSTSSPPAP
jgi:maltokinase